MPRSYGVKLYTNKTGRLDLRRYAVSSVRSSQTATSGPSFFCGQGTQGQKRAKWQRLPLSEGRQKGDTRAPISLWSQLAGNKAERSAMPSPKTTNKVRAPRELDSPWSRALGNIRTLGYLHQPNVREVPWSKDAFSVLLPWFRQQRFICCPEPSRFESKHAAVVLERGSETLPISRLVRIWLATKTRLQRFKVYDVVLHHANRRLRRDIAQYEKRETQTVHQPRRPKIAVHTCPERFPVVLCLGAGHGLESLVPKLRQDDRDCKAPSMVKHSPAL